MKLFSLILLFFAASLTVSQAQKADTLKYAQYNVENLFDTEDDPAIDDAEYLPGSKINWTPERYSLKLKHIAQVIESIGLPDVLTLCEVENKRVLEDLINEPALKPAKYTIVHFNSPDNRGIDVAILVKSSKLKVENAVPVRVDLGKDAYPTRDILVARIKTGKKSPAFYVLANHWPSRRGGQEESTAKRISAAQTARKIIDSLHKVDPQALIFCSGDYNDTPQDESITLLQSKDLFNPFFSLAAQGIGSLYYKGEFNMLDQVLMTKNLEAGSSLQYVSGSAKVEKPSFMVEPDGKYAGSPIRTYIGTRYVGGYSDHFPVSVLFTVKRGK